MGGGSGQGGGDFFLRGGGAGSGGLRGRCRSVRGGGGQGG